MILRTSSASKLNRKEATKMKSEVYDYAKHVAFVLDEGRESGCEYAKKHDQWSKTRNESAERLESLLEFQQSSKDLIMGEMKIIDGTSVLLGCYYYDAVQGLLDCVLSDDLDYSPDQENEYRMARILADAQWWLAKNDQSRKKQGGRCLDAFCRAVAPGKETE